MKVIYVKAGKGKPLSLSCSINPKENHYLSINQKMVDGGIPYEVPDNKFYDSAIQQGLLEIDHSENASKKWKAYISEKTRADTQREKNAMKVRVAKLEAGKVDKLRRGKAELKPLQEAVT